MDINSLKSNAFKKTVEEIGASAVKLAEQVGYLKKKSLAKIVCFVKMPDDSIKVLLYCRPSVLEHLMNLSGSGKSVEDVKKLEYSINTTGLFVDMPDFISLVMSSFGGTVNDLFDYTYRVISHDTAIYLIRQGRENKFYDAANKSQLDAIDSDDVVTLDQFLKIIKLESLPASLNEDQVEYALNAFFLNSCNCLSDDAVVNERGYFLKGIVRDEKYYMPSLVVQSEEGKVGYLMNFRNAFFQVCGDIDGTFDQGRSVQLTRFNWIKCAYQQYNEVSITEENIDRHLDLIETYTGLAYQALAKFGLSPKRIQDSDYRFLREFIKVVILEM